MAMMGGVKAQMVFFTGMWLIPTANANHPQNNTTTINARHVDRLGIPDLTDSNFDSIFIF
jgi:hypothetical protein